MSKTTIKQAIDEFLLNCKVEGKSWGTIDCYADKLKGFLWYATNYNWSDDISEITTADDGLPLKQSPSSKRSLPVYHVEAKGRPEASTKSSIGKGLLLLMILLALLSKSQPSIAAHRTSTFTTQPPQVNEHGLYTFRVGDTVVYSFSPIPFW